MTSCDALRVTTALLTRVVTHSKCIDEDIKERACGLILGIEGVHQDHHAWLEVPLEQPTSAHQPSSFGKYFYVLTFCLYAILRPSPDSKTTLSIGSDHLKMGISSVLALEAALKCLLLRLAYESIEKSKFAEPERYLKDIGADYDPLSFGPTEVIPLPPFSLFPVLSLVCYFVLPYA